MAAPGTRRKRAGICWRAACCWAAAYALLLAVPLFAGFARVAYRRTAASGHRVWGGTESLDHPASLNRGDHLLGTQADAGDIADARVGGTGGPRRSAGSRPADAGPAGVGGADQAFAGGPVAEGADIARARRAARRGLGRTGCSSRPRPAPAASPASSGLRPRGSVETRRLPPPSAPRSRAGHGRPSAARVSVKSGRQNAGRGDQRVGQALDPPAVRLALRPPLQQVFVQGQPRLEPPLEGRFLCVRRALGGHPQGAQGVRAQSISRNGARRSWHRHSPSSRAWHRLRSGAAGSGPAGPRGAGTGEAASLPGLGQGASVSVTVRRPGHDGPRAQSLRQGAHVGRVRRRAGSGRAR